MTVAEMLDRMSSKELTEWMAYANLEPFGEERKDLRAGMMIAPILNMWGKGRKKKPTEWILDFVSQGLREVQSPSRMKSILQGLASAMSRKKPAPQKEQKGK